MVNDVTLPPALLASGAHPRMGARYGFVPTSTVLMALQHEGFQVASAVQRQSRSVTGIPYAKHLVRLRHADGGGYADGTPEVVLINAHDGSAALTMMAGWFRFVCSNGLIVGDHIQTFKAYHRQTATLLDNVIEGAFEVIGAAGQLREVQEAWRSTSLRLDDRLRFAERALAIRWPSADDNTPVPGALLTQRRSDDSGTDLWTTFNVVQENLFAPHAGMRQRSVSDGRFRRSRPVRSINPIVRWNRELWNIASEFAGAA